MKVLVCEFLLGEEMREIDGSLASMQEVVGGNIETIYPFDDPTVVLVCNESGKLENLPVVKVFLDANGNEIDAIAGTFFLCSIDLENACFCSLSDEQLEYYAELFRDRFFVADYRCQPSAGGSHNA